MDINSLSTKIDLKYSDKNVIFRISDCCLNKKHSLCTLNRVQSVELINFLKEKEKMTWSQLSSKARDVGLTPEKKYMD